ncbi:hypothetical protein EV426DRAFT_580477 [Tirmania nivea]|nr:hypothetical protein EV426DRAFT_580477 [Tirmania nivea]
MIYNNLQHHTHYLLIIVIVTTMLCSLSQQEHNWKGLPLSWIHSPFVIRCLTCSLICHSTLSQHQRRQQTRILTTSSWPVL